MAGLQSTDSTPQDIVAIFHTSFHPTQGNVVDWSMKASDNIDLRNVEYSSLPSGLHTIQEDVVYILQDGYSGICVFRRRPTDVDGHRGSHLSSIGILLEKSTRARPWTHLQALQDLADTLYQAQGRVSAESFNWAPAVAFFESRKLRTPISSTQWKDWETELQPLSSSSVNDPILHLPHLLNLFGPSFVTIYKHVLGRRRIMLYTAPPIEGAGILSQLLADLCLEDQLGSGYGGTGEISDDWRGRPTSRSGRGIVNLGTVTLHDMDRLEEQSSAHQGWIACTTDALFLEKQKSYDLLIDTTAAMSRKGARPILYSSNPDASGSRQSQRHNIVRFTWSDLKLWMEIDRVLQVAAALSPKTRCCKFSASQSQSGSGSLSWWDSSKVYEDVCVFCAGWWMAPWRVSPSAIRLEGDDNLPNRAGPGTVVTQPSEIVMEPTDMEDASSVRYRGSSSSGKRTSSMSIWNWSKSGDSLQLGSTDSAPEMDDGQEGSQDADLRATLALLRIFHRHTSFLLFQLSAFIPQDNVNPSKVVLTAKDMLSFNLGPYSDTDGQFLQWLMKEYAGNVQVVVKKNWRDIVSIALGLNSW